MRRVLNLIFVVIVLSGCSKRVDLSYHAGVDEEFVEVTFGGGIGTFSTSGLKVYSTDKETIAKQRISFKGLRIVLYSTREDDSSQPDKVVYAFDKDINAEDGVFSGKDYLPSFILNNEAAIFSVKGKEKIKVDNYIIYYFTTANKQLIEATSVGKPFSEIEGSLSYDVKEDFNRNKLSFNHYFTQEPILVKKSFFSENNSTKVYQITGGRLTALNALLSVKWKKVITDQKYEIIDDALLFYADVQNMKYFLFPKMDEDLKTKYRLDYPIDPNYTGYTQKSLDELKSDFFYSDIISDMFHTTSSLAEDFNNKYRPIPENTVGPNETGANVITRVLLAVRIMPKELVVKLTPEKIKDNSTGWVNYKGTPYESEEFLQMYNEASKAKAPTPEQTELVRVGKKIMQEKNTPQDDNLLIIEGYQDDEIQFYKQSYSYFIFPITHAQLDAIGNKADAGGYYGVVRNHHYEYKINAFATIGNADYGNFGYTLDYLSERFTATTVGIDGMTEITNEIDELF